MKTEDTSALSFAELIRARRELRRMLLRRGLSLSWVEENTEELLSRAAAEYAAKLAEGMAVRSPVGWLINCAWWRAKDLLTHEGRQVQMRTLEAADQLPDEQVRGPEQRALDRDSDERLRNLFAELPERERRLLSLIYFEDHSVREAAEKVGLPHTTANRRHNAVLRRLRERFGSERSLPSVAGIGLILWRSLAALRHRAAELWRRGGAVADPTGPLLGSGGGRALGACGVAAATLICGAAAGVLPALPTDAPAPRSERPHQLDNQASAQTPSQTGDVRSPADSQAKAVQASAAAAPAEGASQSSVRTARSAAPRHGSATVAAAPQSGAAQTTNEFGAEQGQGSTATTTPASTAAGSASQVSEAATVSPAPPRPTRESAARTRGASSGSEFGF